MTTNAWIAWLLAAVLAATGSIAAADPNAPGGAPQPSPCGAVVDDGSPF